MMKRLSEWLSAHGRALLTQARDGNLISYIGDRLIVRFKIRPFYGIEGWLKIEEAAALYHAMTISLLVSMPHSGWARK
jgi:hypothetical protein